MEKELVEPHLTENTKAVFGELIGNPALNVMDIRETADFLHEKGIPLIVDSTTATPYLVNPIQYGADVVVHSTSKIKNGKRRCHQRYHHRQRKLQLEPTTLPGMADYKKYGNLPILLNCAMESGETWAGARPL